MRITLKPAPGRAESRAAWRLRPCVWAGARALSSEARQLSAPRGKKGLCPLALAVPGSRSRDQGVGRRVSSAGEVSVPAHPSPSWSRGCLGRTCSPETWLPLHALARVKLAWPQGQG